MKVKIIFFAFFLISCSNPRIAAKLNDVDASELFYLRISVEKFFKLNGTSDVWNVDDCYYQKSKNKYYVSCGRKGVDKSIWMGQHDIFMIFDKEFYLIEVN